MEVKNAVVQGYHFNMERGLTMFVELDYGDASKQCFGGYLLYSDRIEGGQSCGTFIYRLMQICGVNDLKEVIGRAVRVKAVPSKVFALGHIINDDWFDPDKEL